MNTVIETEHDIGLVRDSLGPIINNTDLLRSVVRLEKKDSNTRIVIVSDDHRALNKTEKSIRRYLSILERLREMHDEQRT